MIGWLRQQAARFRRDDEGAAFILVTITLPIIFGMAAFCVDLGYDHYVRNRSQAAADLGALAGSWQLYKGTAADVANTATSYVNTNLDGMTFAINKNIKATCDPAISALGLDCNGSSGKNAVFVELTATVPSFFASALGIRQTVIRANAFASGVGSAMPPLNIAIVVDGTKSMVNTDTAACDDKATPAVETMTKLACAKMAVQAMLGTLWPAVDHVSLLVYPPMPNATEAKKNITGTGNFKNKSDACKPSCPTTAKYSAWKANSTSASDPTYTVIADSGDYRDQGTPPKNGLDPTKDLVKATGFASGFFGLQAPGGQGTFYADAIKEAQQNLNAMNKGLSADKQRQNVIVLLSDGDAPGGSSTASIQTKQCQQAVDAAKISKDAKTWVYTVAYDASVSDSTCATDSGMSACAALKAVADPNRFYSTDSSTPVDATKCQSNNTTSDLTKIFKNIAVSLMRARRVGTSVCTTCN